jgi:hypothetical protein
MTARGDLHRLIDILPEGDIPTAMRVLEALSISADPVVRSLALAPIDEEPDDDDFDGGLNAARKEAQEGDLMSHDEVKRSLCVS